MYRNKKPELLYNGTGTSLSYNSAFDIY